MRRFFSASLTAISLIFITMSCSGNLSEVEILKHSIKQDQALEPDNFPFSNDEELKSYLTNSKIVNYNLIRKIALLELSETGFLKDLGWKGCRLSQRPITLYNLNSEPRFYDFIVYDPENKIIGTVRTYAQKTESTVISGTYQKCFDYNSMLTKAKTNNPTLFIDWKGEEFVGVKSKAGEAPTNLITKEGRTIANNQVKDLEGEEIIDFFKDNLFSNLTTDKNEILQKLP